jgi:hypothetical protein
MTQQLCLFWEAQPGAQADMAAGRDADADDLLPEAAVRRRYGAGSCREHQLRRGVD